MRCELNDGSVRQVRSEAELEAALKQIGREGGRAIRQGLRRFIK